MAAGVTPAGLPRQGPAGAAGRAEAARPAQHRAAHEGAVTAVAPTPDGLRCLTAGTDSRLRLWDLHTHRWVPTLPSLLRARATWTQSQWGYPAFACWMWNLDTNR